MKGMAAISLILVGLMTLAACSSQPRQGDGAMPYFFSGEIVAVDPAHLQIVVKDAGNTTLSEGATVTVSADAAAADGCPEFAVGEYAKVLMAENAADGSAAPLQALSIYKVDETGAVVPT